MQLLIITCLNYDSNAEALNLTATTSNINILYIKHQASCISFAPLIHRCEEVGLSPLLIKM